MATMVIRQINGELLRRATEIEHADELSARLLRDASDEIDRLRSLFREATDELLRTAQAQVSTATNLRGRTFQRVERDVTY